ncbi:hypothetical protein IMSAGC004_02489 [Bacteroidaceae bacterium]|uniref:hypothetical protein n=1 Tax=uncultured Phocaeicola sp. TaxID=990718 RepID=UPI00143540FA|nr:hypothetical protein [uncultured Phocaeicola sp.]GFI00082.1 hypothetical protein IMSAGC004_02489 [Bacteroidaceae bacterium]
MAELFLKKIKHEAIDMMNAEIERRKMSISSLAMVESSATNIDMSIFVKDEIFIFRPEISMQVWDVPMRSGHMSRVVFVATPDGSVKMFFPSTIRKVLYEAEPNPIEGEAVILTGKKYAANRENFDPDGNITKFYEMALKYPNDLSFYQVLAKHMVSVKVLDRKIVKARSFLDPTRVSNQSVMCIDFTLEGHERENLLKELQASINNYL